MAISKDQVILYNEGTPYVEEFFEKYFEDKRVRDTWWIKEISLKTIYEKIKALTGKSVEVTYTILEILGKD